LGISRVSRDELCGAKRGLDPAWLDLVRPNDPQHDPDGFALKFQAKTSKKSHGVSSCSLLKLPFKWIDPTFSDTPRWCWLKHIARTDPKPVMAL